MRLRFVNHASFVLESGSVRLLCDPWLEGRVFHNGWDQIAPTRFGWGEFSQITHIWFSHEHPDHFFPPNIKRIPEAFRRKITVLYQRTRDHKVAKFCHDLGFDVRELPPRRWETIDAGFRVMNGPCPFYDSWLLIEAEGKRVLNFNDVDLNTERQVRSVLPAIGTAPIDLLATQFSYANGNLATKAARESAARDYLERLTTQAQVFQARFMLPCASFIYFCHEENRHLNDSINTIRAAAERVASTTDAVPIVLYPNDAWELGQPHNNEAALARWDSDYASCPRSLATSQPVPLARLKELSASYLAQVRTKNSPLAIAAGCRAGLFPTARLWLRDLEQGVAFDPRRGLVELADAHQTGWDIELASESLAYVLQFEWGIDTVHVNGRYQATPEGLARFLRAFSLSALNNTGRRFGPALVFDPSLIARALERLVLKRSPEQVSLP